MSKISVCIDVADKQTALQFYTEGLELELVSDQGEYIELSHDGLTVYLSEKASGSNPLLDGVAERNYARHWTPVHLDFHVDDIESTMRKIQQLGGVKEGFEQGEWGCAAFCADPFGNGFCVMQVNA